MYKMIFVAAAMVVVSLQSVSAQGVRPMSIQRSSLRLDIERFQAEQAALNDLRLELVGLSYDEKVKVIKAVKNKTKPKISAEKVEKIYKAIAACTVMGIDVVACQYGSMRNCWRLIGSSKGCALAVLVAAVPEKDGDGDQDQPSCPIDRDRPSNPATPSSDYPMTPMHPPNQTPMDRDPSNPLLRDPPSGTKPNKSSKPSVGVADRVGGRSSSGGGRSSGGGGRKSMGGKAGMIGV